MRYGQFSDFEKNKDLNMTKTATKTKFQNTTGSRKWGLVDQNSSENLTGSIE